MEEEEDDDDVHVCIKLMRIFGPKRDEVTGVRSKLHNEELNDLYSSPTIVRVIKSRRAMQRVWGGDRRVQGFGVETWEKETTGETQA
jgi:hypothetical protein